ncbi:MAG: bacteriocin family protein [Treponemataceae bacterium]|nr:bacteriocin family protein [Treponemataceae bacterium]
MDIFKREQAPIASVAWNEIDKRARQVLMGHLTARRILHVRGPLGWNYAALPEGRLSILQESPIAGVRCGVYQVQPLVETRVSFKLDRWELDNILRGARAIDLSPLDEAAKNAALFEEQAVYNGFAAGGIVGLTAAATQKALSFGKEGSEIMLNLSRALVQMQEVHQRGPFSLILGKELWERANTEVQGYPLMKRIKDMVGGTVVYSSVLEGGLMIPHRHEDLELVIGGDFSIGYEHHDSRIVQLFIAESFTLQVVDPSIILPLQA